MEAYHTAKVFGEAASLVGLWSMVNICDAQMEAIQRLHFLEHKEELNLENVLPATSEEVQEVESVIPEQLPQSNTSVEEEDRDPLSTN